MCCPSYDQLKQLAKDEYLQVKDGRTEIHPAYFLEIGPCQKNPSVTIRWESTGKLAKVPLSHVVQIGFIKNKRRRKETDRFQPPAEVTRKKPGGRRSDKTPSSPKISKKRVTKEKKGTCQITSSSAPSKRQMAKKKKFNQNSCRKTLPCKRGEKRKPPADADIISIDSDSSDEEENFTAQREKKLTGTCSVSSDSSLSDDEDWRLRTKKKTPPTSAAKSQIPVKTYSSYSSNEKLSPTYNQLDLSPLPYLSEEYIPSDEQETNITTRNYENTVERCGTQRSCRKQPAPSLDQSDLSIEETDECPNESKQIGLSLSSSQCEIKELQWVNSTTMRVIYHKCARSENKTDKAPSQSEYDDSIFSHQSNNKFSRCSIPRSCKKQDKSSPAQDVKQVDQSDISTDENNQSDSSSSSGLSLMQGISPWVKMDVTEAAKEILCLTPDYKHVSDNDCSQESSLSNPPSTKYDKQFAHKTPYRDPVLEPLNIILPESPLLSKKNLQKAKDEISLYCTDKDINRGISEDYVAYFTDDILKNSTLTSLETILVAVQTLQHSSNNAVEKIFYDKLTCSFRFIFVRWLEEAKRVMRNRRYTNEAKLRMRNCPSEEEHTEELIAVEILKFIQYLRLITRKSHLDAIKNDFGVDLFNIVDQTHLFAQDYFIQGLNIACTSCKSHLYFIRNNLFSGSNDNNDKSQKGARCTKEQKRTRTTPSSLQRRKLYALKLKERTAKIAEKVKILEKGESRRKAEQKSSLLLAQFENQPEETNTYNCENMRTDSSTLLPQYKPDNPIPSHQFQRSLNNMTPNNDDELKYQKSCDINLTPSTDQSDKTMEESDEGLNDSNHTDSSPSFSRSINDNCITSHQLQEMFSHTTSERDDKVINGSYKIQSKSTPAQSVKQVKETVLLPNHNDFRDDVCDPEKNRCNQSPASKQYKTQRRYEEQCKNPSQDPVLEPLNITLHESPFLSETNLHKAKEEISPYCINKDIKCGISENLVSGFNKNIIKNSTLSSLETILISIQTLSNYSSDNVTKKLFEKKNKLISPFRFIFLRWLEEVKRVIANRGHNSKEVNLQMRDLRPKGKECTDELIAVEIIKFIQNLRPIRTNRQLHFIKDSFSVDLHTILDQTFSFSQHYGIQSLTDACTESKAHLDCIRAQGRH